MLTEKETKEIYGEIGQYPAPANAVIDALMIVQKHRGWVSDEAVSEIARILAVSPDEVDGVASFYSRIYRKPVGRHVILICDSISCMIMGYESLYDHLSKKLGIRFGETTKDGRFTLLPVSCLGDCDHAPAMMIGEDLFHSLTAGSLDAILSEYN